MKRSSSLLWGFAGMIYLILYLPILVMMVHSFNASKFMSHWGGFTFKWYQALLEQEEILHALSNSLWVGFWSTLLSMVLGTMAALALSSSEKKKMGGWVEPLLMCPVILPDIVMGISLLVLFVMSGIHLGKITIIISHITFCMVYVLLVVGVRMKTLDPALQEAARDLGATPLQTFWKITFPLILPGILAGGLLAFTLSFEDFVVTFFTSGVGGTTLPIQIYSMMKFGISPVIAALSTLFLLLTVLAALSLKKLQSMEIK